MSLTLSAILALAAVLALGLLSYWLIKAPLVRRLLAWLSALMVILLLAVLIKSLA